MYVQLYRYLILHQELPIPGIGTFIVHRQPAVVEFADKSISAPQWSIQLQQDSCIPGPGFFNWLSEAINLPVRESVFRFNDFAFEMKKMISGGREISWKGIGIISQSESGTVILNPEPIIQEQRIPAEKVIRKKSSHKLLVGTTEMNTDEMPSVLHPEEVKKAPWWGIPLVVVIISLMFIGWYLSENGLEINSVSNNSRLEPTAEPGLLYRYIP